MGEPVPHLLTVSSAIITDPEAICEVPEELAAGVCRASDPTCVLVEVESGMDGHGAAGAASARRPQGFKGAVGLCSTPPGCRSCRQAASPGCQSWVPLERRGAGWAWPQCGPDMAAGPLVRPWGGGGSRTWDSWHGGAPAAAGGQSHPTACNGCTGGWRWPGRDKPGRIQQMGD